MWKLIATALAIADSGSMSVSSIATDFADRPACEAAAQALFTGTVERELAGHRITIRTAGQCVPDGSPPPPLPPPDLLPAPPPPAALLPPPGLPPVIPDFYRERYRYR